MFFVHITLEAVCARDRLFRVATIHAGLKQELAGVVRIAVLETRCLDVVTQVVKRRLLAVPCC